jgi:hypothetical protein
VDGKFKLADPGFAKFVKSTGKDGKAPKQMLVGGTRTYGKAVYSLFRSYMTMCF